MTRRTELLDVETAWKLHGAKETSSNLDTGGVLVEYGGEMLKAMVKMSVKQAKSQKKATREDVKDTVKVKIKK